MNRTFLATAVLILVGVGAALLYLHMTSQRPSRTITPTVVALPAPVTPVAEIASPVEKEAIPEEKVPQRTSKPEPKLPSGPSPRWSRTVSGKDHPEEISLGVAGFVYLSRLTRQPDDQSIKTIQEVARVDADTANAYLTYLKDSMREYKVYFDSIVPDECKNRDKLQTIPQIADAFTRMGDKAEARRLEIIQGSERVLGSTGREFIENHINRNAKRSMTTVRINDLELLQSMNQAPEIIVARLCEAPAERQ